MPKTSSILEIVNKNGILKVKNPKTGRFLGVGSQTFKSLVKNQILDVRDWETNQVIYEGPNASEVIKGINTSTLGIPASKTVYVKSGKILTRNKRVSREEVNQKMKELTIEVFKEDPTKFKGLSPEEVVEMVNKLVMERMIAGKNNSIQQKMMYIAENIYSDSEDESEFSYTDGDEASDTEDVEEEDEEENGDTPHEEEKESVLEGIGQLDPKFADFVKEEVEDEDELLEKMTALKLKNTYIDKIDGDESNEQSSDTEQKEEQKETEQDETKV